MSGREPGWWDSADRWSEYRRMGWAEADRAAARRLEADALADEVAGRAGALRWWALAIGAGLVAFGLAWWSLRTGG